MPRQNIASLSTILIVTVLVVSLIGVGFASSPVAAQSTPSDADAYLEDGGTYTQGQTLYRDDLESYELMSLYNDETGEHIYTRRANENGEFYIPTEFNSPATYRLEGEQSGTIATYTLEPSQSNTDDGGSTTSGMITFDDYYGDGDPVTEVIVQEATLNEGGFLAVYKNGQFITASDYLSEGTHQDVTIDISSDPVTELSTIRIAPYKDSNNNGEFDSNDESYWGEDSAQSSLSQYGPEEVPPTEPWGTPVDDGTDDQNTDDDSVFTPGGEDPNNGGEENPEGNLPSVPAFLTNPIFLIGGVVLIVVIIIGVLIARQVFGGTGFEDYDPEKDGEPADEPADAATTSTEAEDGSPDPARVDGTTGPTPTQEGPPGATGTSASGGDTTDEDEEKGFGGVTPQEDLPAPVQGDEEDSIQTADDTEEETEPETEEESSTSSTEEDDVEPPTPLDEEMDGEDDEENDSEEMTSETDAAKSEEEEVVEEDAPEEVDEGYGPEPDEEVPPQPGMEEELMDEPVEEDVDTETQEETEPETEEESDGTTENDMEDTDAIKSEQFVEEAKEEQMTEEPDETTENDTTSPSTQYDSTKDPMYGEDTPPAPLHEMEEEDEETSEPEVDSDPEPEEDPEVTEESEESEEDGELGFFGRLRSGLTPDSPSSEEVVDEEPEETTESETEPEPEPEGEDEAEDNPLDDIVAEREVEDDEDDDEEPSATDLVDGGDDKDDDPFSNV